MKLKYFLLKEMQKKQKVFNNGPLFILQEERDQALFGGGGRVVRTTAFGRD